jgi:hypothetical protein
LKKYVMAVAAMMIAGTAQAAPFSIERFAGDVEFGNRCTGADAFSCEWLVAEGRAGNRGPSGDWERGFYDRVRDDVINGNAVSAPSEDSGSPDSFTLIYDGAGGSIFSFLGGTTALGGTTGIPEVDFGTTYPAPVGKDNPTAPAQTLYLRARNANLSGLSIMTGGSTHAVDDGLLTGIGSADAAYLVIGGFDLTAPWTLTGNAFLEPGRTGSSAAFQIKVTDVAPIPLPAAAWMLLSAMGGLGVLGWRKRQTAA